MNTSVSSIKNKMAYIICLSARLILYVCHGTGFFAGNGTKWRVRKNKRVRWQRGDEAAEWKFQVPTAVRSQTPY